MKKQSRFILFAFLVVLLLAATAIAASATVRNVDTQAELESALSAVKNGDEIVVTASMSVSGDITFSKSATYTVRGSSSDVIVTLTSGSFLINAGNVTFSGGTFVARGDVLFDIALSKDKGDGFTITGGTYTLEDNGRKGGAILRTRVGADSSEIDKDWNNSKEYKENWFADPTKIIYLNDVDIVLSGGVFIDRRTISSQLIDATASNSKVVIGNAVFLSRYAKNYIVDINNENSKSGEDIPFAKNTVVVQYNDSNYYCYKPYQGNDNTTYSPVMVEGASVALVHDRAGLLFFSTIPSSVVAALAQKSYTFGTLIAPADYVAAAGSFTHAKLKTWGETNGVSPYCVDIPANKSVIYQTDGSIDFNGGLIYLNSCERAYAAVAYVCVDGTYYYSTYDVTENARTMAQISKIAYTDYSLVQTEDYLYASKYRPGAYSEFSTEEQALLQTYCQHSQTLTTATGVTPAAKVAFDGVGTNLKDKANALKQTIENYGYGNSGMPLLVGTTGATAKQALAEVEGFGYYIGVVDQKIVIAGSNDALTMQALSVFEAICEEANGAPFDLTEIVVSNVQMTVLNTETPIVYSHTRDLCAYRLLPQYVLGAKLTDAYSGIEFRYSGKHLYNTEENEWKWVEYPLYAATEIGEAIMGAYYNCIYVPDNYAMSGGAIHVGLTDLARELLLEGEKDVGYYGYFVKDGNVVVTSYDDATLRLAKSLFIVDLADYALDVDGNGTADVYAIPAGYEFEKGYNHGFTGAFDSVTGATGTGNVADEVKKLVTNYPRPDTLALSGAVNVSNGELELYYLNATLDDYTRYFNKLKENGYTVYMAERVVEDSYFVTLVNRSANNGAGIMLHLMYNAYKHASMQPLSTGTTLDAMFTPTLRVISSTITDSVSYVNHILPEKFLTKQQYTKVTDSKLTVVQRPHSESPGKGCYIYTLEDGSFVVIDGGYTTYYSDVYNVLEDLFYDVHDEYPSSQNPIRIAAWYLTHGHGDHAGLLNSFSTYYLGDIVRLDGIITNFPSNDEIYNAHSINQGTLNKIGTSSWFTGTSSGSSEEVPFYNVHTGQKFFIGNLEFEVMFTPEDIHPWATTTFNDACTVIRLTVHAHNVAKGGTVSAGAVASSKVSTMSLGDIYPRTSRSLRATYGSYLESDIMMNAHHGSGGEGELYELINPQIILWQNQALAIAKGISNTSSEIYKHENYDAIKNVSWRYIISSYRLNSGTYNPTITFGASGVAGLGKASTPEEVLSEATAFLNGLTNSGSTDELSYGKGYFIGQTSKTPFGLDFSTGQKTNAVYSGEGYLLWRGNFFSDTTLPEQPEPEQPEPEQPEPEQPEPEQPNPEQPMPAGDDVTFDVFGDEILLPEFRYVG